MADHCGFCDTRRPEGGTNMLILGGSQWLEFCGPCGDTETLTNEATGEKKTVRQVFDLCSEGKGSLPDPALDTPVHDVPEDLRAMLGDDPAKEESPPPLVPAPGSF